MYLASTPGFPFRAKHLMSSATAFWNEHLSILKTIGTQATTRHTTSIERLAIAARAKDRPSDQIVP